MYILLLITNCFVFSLNFTYEPTWESLDKRPLPLWYDQAKIGIFIHWGLYSVPAFHSEWFWYYWKQENRSEFEEFVCKHYGQIKYSDFASMFKASYFNASYWSALFKAAGARYVVLTSKHHEGYAMWPSSYSWMWNSFDTGPHLDIVGELSKSVRANNMKFGIYYSLYEWFNPMYNFNRNFTELKVWPELKELINKYKPEIIWSDGDWEQTEDYWKSKEFLAFLYNQSPVSKTVVVNDRWGIGTYCKHGDFWNCKDHYLPNTTLIHKWENAFSLDRKSWGYRSDIKSDEIYTTEELIKEIVETVSKNGNVLINVGPTQEGRIPAIIEERLLSLGRWLKLNGEAIYESKISQQSQDLVNNEIYYTQSSNSSNFYAIITNTTHLSMNYIVLYNLPDKFNVQFVELLGCTGKSTIFRQKNTKIIVHLIWNTLCMSNLKWAFTLKFS